MNEALFASAFAAALRDACNMPHESAAGVVAALRDAGYVLLSPAEYAFLLSNPNDPLKHLEPLVTEQWPPTQNKK